MDTETVLPHSEMRVGGQAGHTALALGALGVGWPNQGWESVRPRSSRGCP